MKKKILTLTLSTFILSTFYINSQSKVYTTYLWHMDQPVYWPDFSKDKPESKQYVEESHRLKADGTNMYSGSSVAHPTNNLEEIFSKDDRKNAYQSAPRNAISSIKDLINAGAQLSISGGLLDNIQSLGAKNQWGYSSGWMNHYKEAYSWKTSGGFPRLDIVNFTNNHTLSPLVSEKTLIKEIQAHKYSANKYYGSTSKGYWPAECAFSENIIKALVLCGIEWSVVANSHLARTLSDYVHPFNINGNIDAPNKADIISTAGTNWKEGTIDGRGVVIAAPYCYQAHKAQYIDPNNGTAYTIDVVPMCNFMSYVDGYSGENANDVTTRVANYSNTNHPSIVLLAHDGDNAWGGGSSYYNEAVTSFSHGCQSAGYPATTIQQFLNDNPVPVNDIVHVEDGAWVNAADDWGHPQFINWLWPLYSKQTYRFDPSSWTEDAYNWSILTATENYVTMSEDLEGGNLRTQYFTDGGVNATNAEKAWHFYMGGLNSGFMYYGKAEDMEVKKALSGNIAIDYANKVITANSGIDNTPPTVFIPQRFPHNPGEFIFGALSSYKKVAVSSDFDIWTYAYDVSGLTSVTLKYRTDYNRIVSNENKTYLGGSSVSAWISKEMTRQSMAAAPIDGELNLFITPKAKADLCYAEIKGMKDTLIDYYVEAIDIKGNVYKSPIQHVWVGSGSGNSNNSTSTSLTWLPTAPKTTESITVTIKNKSLITAPYLHWGVNAASSSATWTTPISAYQPQGSTLSTGNSIETAFTKITDSTWQVTVGPFNNTSQIVNYIDFVIKYNSSTWDNNGGSNYIISITQATSNNPIGLNISKSIDSTSNYTFSIADFNYNSPISNTFKGIKIISLPNHGTLTYSGSAVSENQLITDVSQLVYQSANLNGAFNYKIVDSGDLISDATYSASFNINIIAVGINIKFQRPIAWGTSIPYIWAWISTGNIFTESWPGVQMTDIGNNCFSYTFDPKYTNISIIINKGNNQIQSANKIGITSSVSYSAGSEDPLNNFILTPIATLIDEYKNKKNLRLSIYPQPVLSFFNIDLPNVGDQGLCHLEIFNISGQKVLTKVFSGCSITIEKGNLQSGMYIIKITPEKSKKIYGGNFIVK